MLSRIVGERSRTFGRQRIFVLSTIVAAALVLGPEVGPTSAQETFPPNRTRGEIESQIQRLEQQAQSVDQLMRENAQRMFDGLNKLVSRGADGVLGPFFGREREYAKLEQTVQELDVALHSGSGTFAVAKAREAHDQASGLIKRLAGTLSGSIDPRDLGKQLWESRTDFSAAASGASTLGNAKAQDENLKGVLTKINKDIDALRKAEISAPYDPPHPTRTPKPPAAPAPQIPVIPPTRGAGELDDAVRLLDWLDKGNRSFSSAAERQAFFAKFPEMRRFESIAETRSPADDVQSTGARNAVSPVTSTQQLNVPKSQPQETQFKPPTPGTREYEAWQANQAKVGAETVRNGQSRPPTPIARADAASQSNQAKGSAQQSAVTPSPAVGVQTYSEGNYQVHIFENQGARTVQPEKRSVLVLGLGSGPGSTLNAADYINPDTGRRFDVVIGVASKDPGAELVRVLRDHGDAGPNAAAVKSAVADHFQGPLTAGTVTMHSNGNPVGITGVLDGAFTGVKQINMVDPDIGYGGSYLSENSLQQLKTTGVNTVNIYRNPLSFVTRLGELSAAIGDSVTTGAVEAVNAVSRQTMGRNLIDGAVADVQGINEAAARPNSPNRPTVNAFEIQARSTSWYNVATTLTGDHAAKANLDDIYAFKNDTRVVTPLTPQATSGSPKGVHILIREEVLAKALSQGTTEENLRLLDTLGTAIRSNRDQAAVQAAIEEFCDALKFRFKNGQHSTQLKDTVMVSLRTLAERAAPYVDRWNELPEALRYPGAISRIYGYVVVPERNDVVLIGTRGTGESRIELDDLIVGLKAVWQEGKTPFCSLDPDPQAIDGPQTVRVDGVPSDSGFALKMLDADYLMKRILLGLEAPQVPGYESYRAILARRVSARQSANRFWAYPLQPQAGEIQISADLHEALYSSGVQILTEEMMRTQDGFSGIGAVNPEAEEAAAMMTSRFDDLASRHPAFQRLQGLFDIVLTAKLLRHTQVTSDALGLIARLPRTIVHVEPTYKGLKVTFQGPDGMIVLGGGVHAKANATDRALLTLANQQFRKAAATAQAASEQSVLATDAAQVPLAVTKSDPNRRDRAQLSLFSARARLKANDPAGAMNQLDIAIRNDGSDPELRAFRAILSLSRGDVGQARSDSLAALTMDPDNPQIETISSTVLFQCDLLEGKPDLAMQWIERSLRADPFSASAHTRRAEALLALGRPGDARLEFRKAVTADPTSALAVARLARLELAEGWLTTGRRLIQKAVELSAMLNQRIPEIQVAQAEAVLALGFYGNAKTQIAEASRIAEELLADKACDLPSAIGAYGVLIRAALLAGDVVRSDALVVRARGLSPTSPAVLIEAASSAHQLGRNDVARKYIAEAAKLAPDNTAIRELTRLIAEGR